MSEQIERIVNHAAQRGDNIDHLRASITDAYVAGMRDAARIANGWHISKGGYTELAHTIESAADAISVRIDPKT